MGGIMETFPLIECGMEFQWIIEESINHGITKIKDKWMHHVDDQDFRVWEDRRWWEHLGPEEEVDRLEEALNKRRIRMDSGDDKI